MVKVINEENDNKRLILENAKVKYIINAGSGQYGKENVVVVFETESEAYFWVTGSKIKALADFSEGDRCNIQAHRYGNGTSRYISNVKRLDK